MMLRPEIAAVADLGWPDFFNSGVFVFVPSEVTYRQLCEFAVTIGTFDGGDQGLLNLFFADWHKMDGKPSISRPELPKKSISNTKNDGCSWF